MIPGVLMNIKSAVSNPYQNIQIKKQKDATEKFVYKDMSQVKTENSADIAMKNKIARLEMREKEIIEHERTHMAVGGNLASSVSYVYTNGPDGKRYISGGQVDMKMPSGGGLNNLLSGLRRIKSAATSVGDPSGTDLQTAAIASAIEASILKEMALKKSKAAYNKTQEIKNKPKITKTMSHIDRLIEKSYISKLSTMKFRTLSKFEMFI
jgi:hypothetical protein